MKALLVFAMRASQSDHPSSAHVRGQSTMTNRFITYRLIRLRSGIHLTIGRFGNHYFPAGDYAYTGSARRNIEARIARHLRQEKKLRWHIDYLLSAPEAEIIKVEKFMEPECRINQNQSGTVLLAGFGASDCRSACGSHLKYLGRKG